MEEWLSCPGCLSLELALKSEIRNPDASEVQAKWKWPGRVCDKLVKWRSFGGDHGFALWFLANIAMSLDFSRKARNMDFYMNYSGCFCLITCLHWWLSFFKNVLLKSKHFKKLKWALSFQFAIYNKTIKAPGIVALRTTLRISKKLFFLDPWFKLLVQKLVLYTEVKERWKKDTDLFRLVGGYLNKQGNLQTRLVLEATRWVDLGTHLPES